jgi:membrane-associated protein
VSSLVSHVLDFHGVEAYALVGGLCFAESAFLVTFFIPGETALVFGGVLASRHHVALAAMVAVAIGSTALGYFFGFAIGRIFGPRLLERPWVARRPQVERTRATVVARGGTAVVIARFIPFVRAFMPGVAGASGVTSKVFARANLFGAVVWGTTYTVAGFLVGEAYARFVKDAASAAELLGAVVVLVLLAHWLRSRMRARVEG